LVLTLPPLAGIVLKPTALAGDPARVTDVGPEH